ncbi:MAG TPA: hypothetical protein PK089_05960 [Methanoregulaceae archaeon]|nr:hypothetical protein [Methanoregulaceae archaeon]
MGFQVSETFFMEGPGEESGYGRVRKTGRIPVVEGDRPLSDQEERVQPRTRVPPGLRPLVGPYVEPPFRPSSAPDGGPPPSNRDRADQAAIRLLERRKAERHRGVGRERSDREA